MKEYFKPVARFTARQHPFDIGQPYLWWKGHYDRHFLNNLYERRESEFDAFYHYHLDYFLKVNDGASSEKFFKHVWDLVNDGIATLLKEDEVGSKRKHQQTNIRKAKLREFIAFLGIQDTFNARPPHLVIAEKETVIARQQQQIETLEKRLAAMNEFEVAQKVRIEEGHLPTLIDVIRQLRELTLPDNGRKLLRCDYKTPYYKMVSKYFSIEGKDIPVETAKNYFTDEQSAKGTLILPENKLFQIMPVKAKITRPSGKVAEDKRNKG